MDVKISGRGNVVSGEYDHIHISGSGKLDGLIRCKSYHCSGSSHCSGTLKAQEAVRISGATQIGQDLQTGELRVSGSCSVDGNCVVTEESKISGAFHCKGDLKANKMVVSGSIQAGNIEAEELCVSGKTVCSGLLNAEKIGISFHRNGSEVGSIGGSVIDISQKSDDSYEIVINLFFFKYQRKKIKNGHAQFVVRDSIEGDEITLDHVIADTVVGRVVKIGAGCRIKNIRYSESLTVDKSAEVEHQTKQ